jgi:hypothetical protein
MQVAGAAIEKLHVAFHDMSHTALVLGALVGGILKCPFDEPGCLAS